MGKTVEETYKKVNHLKRKLPNSELKIIFIFLFQIDNLEHVLLRPDMYVGSVESVRQNMWIYDTETDRLITKGKNFKLVAFFKVDLSHFVVINDFLKKYFRN